MNQGTMLVLSHNPDCLKSTLTGFSITHKVFWDVIIENLYYSFSILKLQVFK